MNKLTYIILFSLMTAGPAPAAEPDLLVSPVHQAQRMQWWNDARFGMFVHWGLYSIPAGRWGERSWNHSGAEWIQQKAGVPANVYQKELLPQFRPKPDFATAWAQLAKMAGCRYLVFTSKHHDGFALHDSPLTDFDAKDACGRDVFEEIVEATRAEGLKVGAYHSLIDWHHPQAYAGQGLPTVEGVSNDGRDNAIYVNYLHGQVKEIMSNYGSIDILWWDFSSEQCQGESWRAKELMALVRKYQPQIVMNNRLYRSAEAGWPDNHDWSKGFYIDPQYGDFCTPEQRIPANGIEGVYWETCMTMNKSWGYNQHDHAWKSSTILIRNLIDIVSKGGNYLLNVGPKADGSLPEESIERMKAIGEWMNRNGDAIYGTTASPYGKPAWGRYTQKPGTLYAHIFEWPEDCELSIPLGNRQPSKVYILADKGQEACPSRQTEKNLIIGLPADAPDPVATVVVIEYKNAEPP